MYQEISANWKTPEVHDSLKKFLSINGIAALKNPYEPLVPDVLAVDEECLVLRWVEPGQRPEQRALILHAVQARHVDELERGRDRHDPLGGSASPPRTPTSSHPVTTYVKTRIGQCQRYRP